MTKKKILIFSLAYYPKHVGGAEVAIKEITDRISPEAIEFHAIVGRFDSSLTKVEKIGNVLVHRIGPSVRGADITMTHHPLFYLAKVLYIPLATLKALSLHKKYSYDGFWAMMVYMTFPIALLRLLLGQRVPYVVSLQEGDPYKRVFERWHIRVTKPLLLYGMRHATVVQTISHFLAGWAKKAGYKGTTHVIPNGVAINHFSQHFSEKELNKIRNKIDKKEGNVFLVTTSRLVKKNAVDDIVRAVALLPAHVHCAVIGTGPDEKMLRKLAEELRVGDRLHFLGHLKHAAVPPYLKACDIFVRPSRSEGMGNSFIEAMAAGLPVIGTQEGGIADFLFDEKQNPGQDATGWAVKKNAPEEIARAVETILEDREKTARVVGTAMRMTQEKYDWNLIAKDMHTKVFNSLFV